MEHLPCHRRLRTPTLTTWQVVATFTLFMTMFRRYRDANHSFIYITLNAAMVKVLIQVCENKAPGSVSRKITFLSVKDLLQFRHNHNCLATKWWIERHGREVHIKQERRLESQCTVTGYRGHRASYSQSLV